MTVSCVYPVPIRTASSMRPDAPAWPLDDGHSCTPPLVLLFWPVSVRQKGENGAARSAGRLPKGDTTIAQTRQVDVIKCGRPELLQTASIAGVEAFQTKHWAGRNSHLGVEAPRRTSWFARSSAH